MKLFGILNVTPDSFSDGNQFLQEEKAVIHAKELSKNCYTVDIGAQSTRPNAPLISYSEEITRLGLVISEVSKFAKTSIDSFNFETQKFAVEQGVSYINDVCAFQDTRILKFAPEDIKFIFMHHLTVPPTKTVSMKTQKQEMIAEIKQWALKKLDDFSHIGVSKNRFIFDIGIGFGKSAEQSLYLIENAEQFLDLGIEIMVGHSRKSFMELLKQGATMEERDKITQQITTDLTAKGIHYARVHVV
jgi:dihydropteroate synthase